jgi:hypothetical protein
MQSIDVNMLGLGPGSQRIDLPTNYQRDDIRFLTIMNMTDNTICLYPPNIQQPTAGMSIQCLGVYSAVTVPIFTGLQNGFNAVWTNPGGTNPVVTKVVKLIFSKDNLGYNQCWAPSFAFGGDCVPISIAYDDVGVSKEAQQDTIITHVDGIEGLLTAINAAAATAAKQDTIIAALGAIQDRNQGVEVLPSAERTADPAAVDITNPDGSGLAVIVDITDIGAAAPSITVSIDALDIASGKYYNLLTSAALAAVATTVLQIRPSLVDVPNLKVDGVVPRGIKVSVVHANADPITYSVGANITS